MGGRNVSVRTRAAGALLALSAALVVVVVPQVSSAAPTPSGPGFPPPGGATTSLAPAEGAPPNDGFIGKTGGSTITYAGFAGSFTHMWWGPNQVTSPNLPIPAFAFDGAIDSAGEHLAFASMSGNSATWGSGSSNLKYISGGSYTTRSVLTRFRMIATRASDNSAISWVTPAAAGVASNVGAVIPVPLASGVPQSFKVMRIFEACSPSFTTPSVGTCNIADSNWEPVNNLYNRLNTDPAIRTISSFGAGFFYNRAPSVLPGSLTTNEDTPGAIALSASDPDANPLTYTLTGGPSNGSLSGTAPNLTYTPGPNFNGSDSFTFKVNDGFVDSATAAVSITVNAVNDAPVANAGSLTLDEDTTDGVTLTGSDVEGDALTFEIVGSPANGTLDTSALPVVTYTPGLNYNGADAFTFRAFDGAAYSASVAVAITVTPVNDAPTADDQLTGTPEDIPLPITLTGADVDGDGLSFNVVTPPAHGVLTGSGANLVYVPELDYNGFDSFTFVTNDGIVDSALATVTIEVPPVNDAPVSDNQSVTTDEDTAIAITLQASDVDNINDELSYSIETGPSNGTLVGTGQNLQYVPNANFNGSDSFTFKTNDGEFDSNIATVSITVAAVNDAPVADDLSVTTAEDNALPITVTASDVEGSPLSFEIVDGPDHGTLSGTAPNLTYTPNANYFGDDSFTFKTNDGELDSNVATVAITVTPVNDAPVADDGSATTDEDAPAVITLTGSDIEDDALTYAIVDGPTNGTLELDGPQATYTPFGDYNGPDSFTFKVDDGDLDSNIATVTISVAAVNDAPVAGADVAGTPQYTSVTISVLANDSDIDGDALSVASATDGAKGSTTVNPDGTITYSPTPAFKDSDAFQYVLSDGQGGLATGTVMIVEVGCGEDGIDALAGGPAGGAASRTIDREVEPIVGSVDADLAANLHAYNCAYVVPAEDAVDDLIP